MALTFSRCYCHKQLCCVNSESGWRDTWSFSQSHTAELQTKVSILPMASWNPSISTPQPPCWACLLFWPQGLLKPIKTMHWLSISNPDTPNPFAPQQHATSGECHPQPHRVGYSCTQVYWRHLYINSLPSVDIGYGCNLNFGLHIGPSLKLIHSGNADILRARGTWNARHFWFLKWTCVR